MPIIMWAGRKNYSSPTQVEADIASMVAASGTNAHDLMSCTDIRERNGSAFSELVK